VNRDDAMPEVYPAAHRCPRVPREELSRSTVLDVMPHHFIQFQRQRYTAIPTAFLSVLLCLLASCATTPEETEDVEDETFRPLGPATRMEDTIGKYLGDLSISITAWNEKTLVASTKNEVNKTSLLEINIRERVHNRHTEILGQLLTGPDRNRIIAAAALGFSSDPSDLSPLLAALEDPNKLVVANAMLGLGTLSLPETPLYRIGDLMRFSPNPKTRWSAAHCILTLVAAGAESNGAIEPAVAGLTDAEEPMVRAQSALILGVIGHTDSIEPLGNLLFDEVPIVSVSAAKALAYLGTQNEKESADAARALYRAFASGDSPLSLRVHPSLVRLSNRDYGDDMKDWAKWIKKLP
jgi:hypothetical protein